LRYEIIFAPEAEDDLLSFKAHERVKVLDTIERHLRYEPEKVSKSRIKRLEGIKWPQYRLRIDDIRAFYDVINAAEEGIVEILAIREKSAAVKWLAEHGIETE
jgi:mRNA-degrading endonuclease RelE of RelBE toxin-antitoxin system